MSEVARSPWECLLLNQGNWQGSFCQLSATGELLEKTKSETRLEAINQEQTMRQTVRLFYDYGLKERVLEYSSLARSVLFLPDGSFSQGSTQFSPVGEFGAELGLINPERRRRLRAVPIYQQAELQKITLIPEFLAENTEFERLDLELLLGKWAGHTITQFADWRSPITTTSMLELERLDSNRLRQKLTLIEQENTKVIESIAAIALHGLEFENTRVLFLVDGGTLACPRQIKTQTAFSLELGWLWSLGHRQRLRRNYDQTGAWISLSLTTETKIP
ncbi:MAG: DUF3598 family protein [Pseudanabaenaceae cyanobacterium bins.68]|nr:DUF3598 family protein [Pseudanabaenaceae cyanobacterium bins.68]